MIAISGYSGRLSLTIDGRSQDVAGRVRTVVVYAGAGNDTVDVSGSAFRTYLDGGTGNDSLTGGYNVDTLFGGTGDDTLTNPDMLYAVDYQDGGPGSDQLNYGGTMYGGGGNDTARTVGFDALVGGLETLYNDDDSGQSAVTPHDEYRSDLSTRHGRLVFAYRTDGVSESSVSGPVVLADGTLGVVVHLKAADQLGNPPLRVFTMQFNARDTRLA